MEMESARVEIPTSNCLFQHIALATDNMKVFHAWFVTQQSLILLNAPHDPIATQLALGAAFGVAELYTTLQPCSALPFLVVVPQLRGFTPPVAILTEFAHCCSLCVEYMYM